MSHTLIAYEESLDTGALFDFVAAVPDPHVTVLGDDIRIPEGANRLIAIAALTNDATIENRGRFSSPSLRARTNLYLERIAAALVFGSPPEITDLHENPVVLAVDEPLNYEINNNPAAGVINRALAWLSDGAISPITGDIQSIAFTTAITQATATWVNGAITLLEDLQVGRYAVVGLRIRAANLVAARLVFRGSTYRPGVPAVNAAADYDNDIFRRGRLGVWGEFHTNQPPTLDVLGVTNTAQLGILDVVRLA